MEGMNGTTPHDRTPVLIVGGGPVGLLTAYQLARHEIPCIVAERNPETTRWPKMDLTNCRAMEILRMCGLADEYRHLEGAVGEEGGFADVYHTGMGLGGKLIAICTIPSVKEWREIIKKQNDGTHPAEPAHRCSLIIFEAWMKQKCLDQPLIDFRTGWTFQSHTEDADRVTATFVDQNSQTHTIQCQYMVGCDGGRSQVRISLGVKMVGGSLPIPTFLIHFRSEELGELRPFGRYWHAVNFGMGAVINQNDKDIFTINMYIPPGTDMTELDPYESIYRVLGTASSPLKIKIDEVMVHSCWKPKVAVAERWLSEGQRVLLAGDAAHLVPPWGGYGLNSGIEDSFAVSWRLAAMVRGYGGPHLLPSYEVEMKPPIVRRLKISQAHVLRSVAASKLINENQSLMDASTESGNDFRKQVAERLDEQGSMHADHGVELDSRYTSAIIFQDLDGGKEPNFDPKSYTPSTWPGARAPHVFLQDGCTSTLDLYGKDFTLFDFTTSPDDMSVSGKVFATVAKELNIPLKIVTLREEQHIRDIWERNLVLVRPDGHVAWRSSDEVPNADQVKEILEVIIGQTSFPGYVTSSSGDWGVEDTAAMGVTEKLEDENKSVYLI